MATPSSRLNEFKFKGRTQDVARQRRTEEVVQLRKQKREEAAMKRRNIDYDQADELQQSGSELTERIHYLLSVLSGFNPDTALEAIQELRKMLSHASGAPVQEVCDLGGVPLLVGLLHLHQYPEIQFEATWCLTNITSGSREQTHAVLVADAVPILVELLASKDSNVKEQAVWTLANISGDNEEYRDLVLDSGCLAPLLKILKIEQRDSLIRNATWMLCNLCRGKKPPVDALKLKPALPVLFYLIHSHDRELLIDVCWCLVFLSDNSEQKVERIIQHGLVGPLVQLLSHPDVLVVTPALRCIGNLVTGNDRQTQVVLNTQVLPSLRILMNSPKEAIRKETCWVLSNILAGTSMQVKEVIDANIIPDLVARMRDSTFKTRKEACWALSNGTVAGTPAQIQYFVSKDCIPALCEMLGVDDIKTVNIALDAIHNILNVGFQGPHQPNAFHSIFEECGGIDKLEDLQQAENETVYEHSKFIVGTFFNWKEEDGEVARLAKRMELPARNPGEEEEEEEERN